MPIAIGVVGSILASGGDTMPRNENESTKAEVVMIRAGWHCASILVIVGAMLLAGCREARKTASPTARAGRTGGSVIVLVAASVKDAVAEIAGQFGREAGVEVKISSGASNALASQILNDAPGEVFLSANQEWADKVREKGYAMEMRALLSNELVIVVPKGNPGGIKTPEDLKSASVKRIALAGENVPAGKYAEQALKALGVYQSLVDGKKIVRGQDVRVTLSYVERGEVDAGVVYSTDAKASRSVDAVYTFDPKTYEKIVYPLVLLKAGRDNPAARRFYDYLSSAKAEDVFRKHGFVLLK